MSVLKNKEAELLAQLCKRNNLSQKFINQLLKTSEINNYENKPSKIRQKEIFDYISFYNKQNQN